MVRLPYLGALSSQIEKKIGPFLKRQTSGRVKLRVIDKLRKISQFFTIKDHQPTLLRSDVVYKLTCSCGEAYIVETIRNLKIRLREHATLEKLRGVYALNGKSTTSNRF